MSFRLLPVLNQMAEIYALPRNQERFEKYLYLLQGPQKEDLVFPIAGFNPMGKELASSKLDDLIAISAEEVVKKTLLQVDHRTPDTFEVAINLVDDVEGSWSEKASTDFRNRFEIGPMVKRNFCVVYVWTSEVISERLLKNRTLEAVHRTIHFLDHGHPKTLEACLRQEIRAYRISETEKAIDPSPFKVLEEFFNTHKRSEDYALKFNFFYGDQASSLLGYKAFGISSVTGLDWAKALAQSQSSNTPYL